MSRTLWKLGAALAVGLVGLAMLNYGVERSALLDVSDALHGTETETPARIFATLFIGVAALNIAVFSALTVWSNFLRDNPDTKQLPVWVLVTVVAISGGLAVTGFAQHYSYIRTLAEPPTEPSMGYIYYMTMCGAFLIAALVTVGVRWAPGQKRRLVES